ncbi:helix-turn-helix transcriptional regulator [Mesorhizobium sp. B1-1-7]|uniref:helix-turn-helix domain-containing protein n=1 Tax=Mesorhizobium sp. B1-1-7 TaxID=2589977 RepID=UPI00112EF244|nr:helix-turn-helix transcriptional regulator [Mesorhizobium sp. B1-1-7]TPN43232.1 helix-turn-helix transcriptional regulator [Mesorhizobium sp. B1-1-7]
MELHERLVAARKQAGFETAVEAAEAVGVPYGTYSGHENGSSGFRRDKGEIYARKFKVRFEWLMLGTGPMVDLASKYRELLTTFDSLPPDLQASYADVLRKLAEPYQHKEPDLERPPAKAKSA